MVNTAMLLARMKSIRQTVQIANAQKLVAASRIGKAKRMLADASPYHKRIQTSIARILEHSPDIGGIRGSESAEPPNIRYHSSEGMRRGLLVLTSDHGLAGGYNSNLVKLAEQEISADAPSFLCVRGIIGISHLSRDGRVLTPPPPISVDPPTQYAAREFAEMILSLYENGTVDCFDIIYTHFLSTVRVNPTIVRLLPLAGSDTIFPDSETEPDKFGQDTDIPFEPDAETVLSILIPQYLKGFIYGCLVHSWAAELASRVMAMDSAIRNGNEMLDVLSLEFNRARQAKITQEITEIVAGAAAME